MHFKQCSADAPLMSDFLENMNISRVELDNLLQGVSRPCPGLKGSLYYPYAYVTVTRYCMMPRSAKAAPALRHIPLKCGRECRGSEYELTHKDMPVKLLLKGNTQFFRNDKLPEDLHELNIDRLVFEPAIPL